MNVAVACAAHGTWAPATAHEQAAAAAAGTADGVYTGCADALAPPHASAPGIAMLANGTLPGVAGVIGVIGVVTDGVPVAWDGEHAASGERSHSPLARASWN